MENSGDGIAHGIRLCERVSGGKECIYLAVQKMLNIMKQDIAKAQAIPYPEQIVVAKIYELVSKLMAESCRRHFGIGHQDCEPSAGYGTDSATLDTFILLNQLKEDRFITEGYKNELFQALTDLSPDIKRLVESDAAQGLL